MIRNTYRDYNFKDKIYNVVFLFFYDWPSGIPGVILNNLSLFLFGPAVLTEIGNIQTYINGSIDILELLLFLFGYFWGAARDRFGQIKRSKLDKNIFLRLNLFIYLS